MDQNLLLQDIHFMNERNPYSPNVNDEHPSPQIFEPFDFNTLYQTHTLNQPTYPSPSNPPINRFYQSQQQNYLPMYQQPNPMLIPQYNSEFYSAMSNTYLSSPTSSINYPYENIRKADEVVKKKAKSKKRKNKTVDPNAPPKPKRKTGLNKPLILSPALSEIMDGATELSRPELVKKLWTYIKENNLQDPSDRRFILCDAKLEKVFEKERINSFGMNKDLSAHLTKKEVDQSSPLEIQENTL